MMIYGIGTDIIEIERIQRAIARHPNFLTRYFTPVENAYFSLKKGNPQSIAGYFAAKEAISKALGTGFHSFGFKDIEITKDSLNKPVVHLYEKAKAMTTEKGIETIHLSISHCKEYAIAYAIAVKKGGRLK